MSWLDLDSWPRRDTFRFFRAFELPFFNLCAPVDVTALRGWCRAREVSFFYASWFAVLRAIDDTEALRMRLRGDRVWVHERVGIGSTILRDDGSFGFCYFDPAPDLPRFVEGAERARAAFDSATERLQPHDHRDDLIHGTVIPWIAFTSVAHPRRVPIGSSVPKISLGRFSERDGRVTMPVSLEAHHALCDGLHAGQFYQRLQHHLDSALDQPVVLEEGQ